MKRTLSIVAVAVILSALACAKSGSSGPVAASDAGASASSTLPTGSDVTSFCASLCEQTAACDSALDDQTCKNTCQNAYAAVFPRLRADVVELVVGCFGEQDCKTMLGGGIIETCSSEAVARVVPSDAAVAYCDAFTSAKQRCGARAAKASCLEGAKLYSDEAIAQATNCVERSCTEIDGCVGAVFGALSAAPRPDTPTATCRGQYADLGECTTCAEGPCCAEALACSEDPACRRMLAACGSGVRDLCYDAVSPSTTTESSRQLAGAFLNCARSSCTTTCRFPE